MLIGVPAETLAGETRVAVTPETAMRYLCLPPLFGTRNSAPLYL